MTSPDRWRRLLLPAVFAATLVLQGGGLAGDLPLSHRTDEVRNAAHILSMVDRGSLDPQVYSYPALFFNLHAGPWRLARVVAPALGGADPSDPPSRPIVATVGTGFAPAPWVLLLFRLQALVVSASLAALTTAAARRAGAHLLPAALVGLVLGASLLATSTGATLAPDGPAALFVLGAVWAALPGRQDGDLLVAGLCTGAAAACKYTAGLVLLVPLLAGVRSVRGLALLLGATGVVFGLGNPTLLTHPAGVLEGLAYESAHYSGGHAGAEGAPLPFYLRTLGMALGPALLLLPAALAGERRRGVLAILAFVGLSLLFLGRFPVRFARNVLPLSGPLLVVAALGAQAVWAALGRRQIALGAVGLLLAASGVAGAIASRRVIAERHSDALVTSRDWLADRVPPSARLLVEGYGPFVSDLGLSATYVMAAHEAAADLARDEPPFDLLVLAEGSYGRYLQDPAAYGDELHRYAAIASQWCELARFEGGDAISVLAPARASAGDCSQPLLERFSSALTP
ncbi:MAG: hypothetical protein H6742_04850 [Alphaproteobacteria bacterium]|nr:hypothetical protein [Alphaproteobacteria bacterium]